MMRSTAFRTAMALGVLVACAAAPAVTAFADARSSFIPHRALYSMKLAKTKSGSDVIDVDGRMAFEWRRECEGWTVQQHYRIRFFGADGEANEIASSYNTWEAIDGKHYRFFVKKHQGGQVKEVSGVAERQGDIRFAKPEKKTVKLSEQAIFPSEHTFELIDRALKGEKFFSTHLFDGGEFEPDTPVTAVIGRRSEPKPGPDRDLNGYYWPIRLAFFEAEAKGSEPDYEMSIDLHPNGIARALKIDYGDFVVNVELRKLEILKGPLGC
ncbi:MAG: cell envelope integrity EipB family protein [Rhodospirillaceae bacterium]|nr:cell envelope integrity EipB family protein [Rhodospirillaceae bacterium]MBT6138958.1 cell envelope integrity EipB family protein [Rhodospirillaceae bacterium]